VSTHHRIPVADGESVAAVHHEAAGERWLLFCHGFGSDREGSYERRCERAVAAGHDAVRFDFRGVGESDGAFAASTLSTRLADLDAVADHFGLDAFAVFGSSFGGLVAFHAAARDDRIESVVCRSPVTDLSVYDERARRVREEGPIEHPSGHTVDERLFDDLDSFDTAAAAERIAVPVAIVHGADDEVVPPAGSFETAAGLDGEALVRQVAGEGHVFSDEGEGLLWGITLDWLDRS
jgi:pimeloyl-ACP methyl ester carboxylesterase